MVNAEMFLECTIFPACFCLAMTLIPSFILSRCVCVLTELWEWLCHPSWCLLLGWWLFRARAQAAENIFLFHWWWDLLCKPCTGAAVLHLHRGAKRALALKENSENSVTTGYWVIPLQSEALTGWAIGPADWYQKTPSGASKEGAISLCG